MPRGARLGIEHRQTMSYRLLVPQRRAERVERPDEVDRALHALQLGMPEVDLLRESRIAHRMRIAAAEQMEVALGE